MKKIIPLLLVLPFLFASCTKQENKVKVYLDSSEMVSVVSRSDKGVLLEDYSDEALSNVYLEKFFNTTDSRRIEYTLNKREADMILEARSLRITETVRNKCFGEHNYELSTVDVQFSYALTDVGQDRGNIYVEDASNSDYVNEEENEDGDIEYNMCRASYKGVVFENLTKVKKEVKKQAKTVQQLNS